MITLLDGTKLPCHGEIYTLLHNNKKIYDFICGYCKRKLISTLLHQKVMILPETISEFKMKIKQERNYWDMVIFMEAPITQGYFRDGKKYQSAFRQVILIEYKSSITEWHKNIDDFIRQINSRQCDYYSEQSEHYGINEQILLSFDNRFQQYENLLNNNNINLVILPQELLLNGGLVL